MRNIGVTLAVAVAALTIAACGSSSTTSAPPAHIAAGAGVSSAPLAASAPALSPVSVAASGAARRHHAAKPTPAATATNPPPAGTVCGSPVTQPAKLPVVSPAEAGKPLWRQLLDLGYHKVSPPGLPQVWARDRWPSFELDRVGGQLVVIRLGKGQVEVDPPIHPTPVATIARAAKAILAHLATIVTCRPYHIYCPPGTARWRVSVQDAENGQSVVERVLTWPPTDPCKTQ